MMKLTDENEDEVNSSDNANNVNASNDTVISAIPNEM